MRELHRLLRLDDLRNGWRRLRRSKIAARSTVLLSVSSILIVITRVRTLATMTSLSALLHVAGLTTAAIVSVATTTTAPATIASPTLLILLNRERLRLSRTGEHVADDLRGTLSGLGIATGFFFAEIQTRCSRRMNRKRDRFGIGVVGFFAAALVYKSGSAVSRTSGTVV